MHELPGKINHNLSNFLFAFEHFYFPRFSLFPASQMFDIFSVIRKGFSDDLINKTKTGCAVKQIHKTQQNKDESLGFSLWWKGALRS